jgi:uncharacterized protein (DUF697 family)
MKIDEQLLDAATKLVEAADKALDSAMPARLAAIVKTHAALGVGAAFIPIPGLDLAAAATAVWSMYYRINDELKMPFGENMVKSVATGVGTNFAAYTGVVAVASVLKAIPGIGTMAGTAMMTAAAYALTLASGYVYMKVLAMLLLAKRPDDISLSDFNTAVEQVMSDKQSVKTFLDQAKTSYKSEAVASHQQGELSGGVHKPEAARLGGLAPLDPRPTGNGRDRSEGRARTPAADAVIRFRCPLCRARLKAPCVRGGRRARCSSCGEKVLVPKASQA